MPGVPDGRRNSHGASGVPAAPTTHDGRHGLHVRRWREAHRSSTGRSAKRGPRAPGRARRHVRPPSPDRPFSRSGRCREPQSPRSSRTPARRGTAWPGCRSPDRAPARRCRQRAHALRVHLASRRSCRRPERPLPFRRRSHSLGVVPRPAENDNRGERVKHKDVTHASLATCDVVGSPAHSHPLSSRCPWTHLHRPHHHNLSKRTADPHVHTAHRRVKGAEPLWAPSADVEPSARYRCPTDPQSPSPPASHRATARLHVVAYGD